MAAILELDENLNRSFKIFEAAPAVCYIYLISSYNPFLGGETGSHQATTATLFPLKRFFLICT